MKPSQLLIVEDDQMIRESLRDLLEEEGFQVVTAANGLLALNEIRKAKGACLVLLDLQMPVMTGEELLRALEKESEPQIRKTPVLVLSARKESFQHEQILGFIRKPLDIDELLAEVHKVCG